MIILEAIFLVILLTRSYSARVECNERTSDWELKCINDTCTLTISTLEHDSLTLTRMPKECISKITDINCSEPAELKNLPHSIVSNASDNSVLRYNFSYGSFKSVSRRHFQNMSRLEKLVLVDGELTIICSDSFDDLISLHALVLHDNEIKFLHPNLFKKLANLKLLHLARNSIGALHSKMFEHLENLNELYLNGNDLIYLDQKQFSSNQNLHVLYLSNNSIVFIHDDTFDGLKSLTDFSIKENVCESDFSLVYDNDEYLNLEELKRNLRKSCSRKRRGFGEIEEAIAQYNKWFRGNTFMGFCGNSNSAEYKEFFFNASTKMFSSLPMIIIASTLLLNFI